jgi:predicted transcriptional regulator
MPKYNDSLRGYAFSVHQRDRFCCRYCGLDGTKCFANWLRLSWDHLLPQSDPRRNDEIFIVTACMFCNGADNRYFDLASTRGLIFEDKSQEELVQQRHPFVKETRRNYEEFWDKNVRNPNSQSRGLVVQLTIEQEAELSRIADETGRSADELAREAVDRYLTEEGRLLFAVRAGESAAARGEFVEKSDVWARIERQLKS